MNKKNKLKPKLRLVYNFTKNKEGKMFEKRRNLMKKCVNENKIRFL